MQPDARALALIGDSLAKLSDRLDKMDHAQDALLVNGQSLQDQMQTVASLVTHLIELVTPDRREQEGPTLADLLARLIQQQAALFDLMKHTLESVTRLEQRSIEAQGRG